ncbi:MAG: hypothetical protein QGH43_09550, partial [Arenicellales bacterium]|nr:hypothetical protein [Arenicellales bacterium]
IFHIFTMLIFFNKFNQTSVMGIVTVRIRPIKFFGMLYSASNSTDFSPTQCIVLDPANPITRHQDADALHVS